MIIISGQKYDQNGCAVRVQEYECGISFFDKNLSSKILLNAIQNIFHDQKYSKRIQQLNDSYQEAKKEKLLENHIESLLK